MMGWKLEEALAYYARQGAPGEQGALVALLREVQQENGGGIPEVLVGEIARAYGVRESLILAIIRRMPSLRLADSHCLELCAGPNCTKQAVLAEFVEKTYGSKPEGFRLKYVPCMRLCGKGPNLRWDGKVYHRADAALITRLVEGKEDVQ